MFSPEITHCIHHHSSNEETACFTDNICCYNWNLLERPYYLHTFSNYVISTKFCKCHDSCAKFCCDLWSCNSHTKEHYFNHFWIVHQWALVWCTLDLSLFSLQKFALSQGHWIKYCVWGIRLLCFADARGYTCDDFFAWDQRELQFSVQKWTLYHKLCYILCNWNKI